MLRKKPLMRTDALYYARQKGNTASVALLEKYFKK